MKFFTIQRFFLLALLISAPVGLAYGQEKPAQKTNVDENFTLNIVEERTTETNYERSKAVELGDKERKNGVQVRVGATVRAQKIDVTLRGITGNGRFRASLEAIRRLLEERSPKPSSEP